MNGEHVEEHTKQFNKETKMFAARDETGKLFLFNNKPERDNSEQYGYWYASDGEFVLNIDENLFPNLTWDDEPLEVTMKQDDSTLALSDNNAQQINHVWAMFAALQQEMAKLREQNSYWYSKFEDIKNVILNIK